MSVDKFIIKDGTTVKETIDLNERVYADLAAGDHTITVEAYLGANFVSSDSAVVNVPASSFDPDYQAVLDAVIANGDTVPDSSQQNIDNQLLIDYKATGGWAKDDAFFKFSGVADTHIGYRLTCWKRRIKAIPFGSLIWSSNGVEGNQANAYIDILFTPSTDGVNYTLNDAGTMVFVDKATIINAATLLGVKSSGTNEFMLLNPKRKTTTDEAYVYINGISSTGKAGTTYPTGLTMLSRLSDTQVEIKYSDGVAIPQTSPSAANLPSLSIFLLAYNNVGSASLFHDDRLKYVSIGGNKTTLHSSIKTVLT